MFRGWKIQSTKINKKKKCYSPIRGIEPRAAAVKSFVLKGGDVSRYTISDVLRYCQLIDYITYVLFCTA